MCSGCWTTCTGQARRAAVRCPSFPQAGKSPSMLVTQLSRRRRHPPVPRGDPRHVPLPGAFLRVRGGPAARTPPRPAGADRCGGGPELRLSARSGPPSCRTERSLPRLRLSTRADGVVVLRAQVGHAQTMIKERFVPAIERAGVRHRLPACKALTLLAGCCPRCRASLYHTRAGLVPCGYCAGRWRRLQ